MQYPPFCCRGLPSCCISLLSFVRDSAPTAMSSRFFLFLSGDILLGFPLLCLCWDPLPLRSLSRGPKRRWHLGFRGRALEQTETLRPAERGEKAVGVAPVQGSVQFCTVHVSVQRHEPANGASLVYPSSKSKTGPHPGGRGGRDPEQEPQAQNLMPLSRRGDEAVSGAPTACLSLQSLVPIPTSGLVMLGPHIFTARRILSQCLESFSSLAPGMPSQHERASIRLVAGHQSRAVTNSWHKGEKGYPIPLPLFASFPLALLCRQAQAGGAPEESALCVPGTHAAGPRARRLVQQHNKGAVHAVSGAEPPCEFSVEGVLMSLWRRASGGSAGGRDSDFDCPCNGRCHGHCRCRHRCCYCCHWNCHCLWHYRCDFQCHWIWHCPSHTQFPNQCLYHCHCCRRSLPLTTVTYRSDRGRPLGGRHRCHSVG